MEGEDNADGGTSMKELSEEQEDNDVGEEGFGIQLPTGADISCLNVEGEGHHSEQHMEEASTV